MDTFFRGTLPRLGGSGPGSCPFRGKKSSKRPNASVPNSQGFNCGSPKTVKLTPGLLLLAFLIQPSIQLKRRTDECHMSKGLREISQMLAGGAQFLRIEA